MARYEIGAIPDAGLETRDTGLEMRDVGRDVGRDAGRDTGLDIGYVGLEIKRCRIGDKRFRIGDMCKRQDTYSWEITRWLRNSSKWV